MRSASWWLRLTGTLAIAACGGTRLVGTSPAPDPVAWRSLIGCYHTAEAHFALDSLPPTFVTLLSPPQGARKGWSYWFHGADAYWRVLSGDTVELVVGNSLYGGRYRWMVRGDSLVGHYSGWSDVGRGRGRPARNTAHREPCAVDGPADAPPPNAAVLSDQVPAAVAAVIADSVLPRLNPNLPVAVDYVSNPFSYSAGVAKLLDRHAAAGNVDDASRVHAEGFLLERDRLGVDVVVFRTCENRPGRPRRMERAHLRFVWAGSAWHLEEAVGLASIDAPCGSDSARP
jgi:hypothetical protein